MEKDNKGAKKKKLVFLVGNIIPNQIIDYNPHYAFMESVRAYCEDMRAMTQYGGRK